MTSEQFIDRRSGADRRIAADRRQGTDRRSGQDRRDRVAVSSVDGRPGAVRPNGRESGAARPRDDYGRWGLLLADLVAGFYRACLDAKEWPEILDRLRETVRGDAAVLIAHDFAGNSGKIRQATSLDKATIASYDAVYGRENPWLNLADKLPPPGHALKGQQLAEDAEVLESRFYQEWAEPLDLHHHLFGVLDAEDGKAHLLWFARGRDKGAFWDDDVAFLEGLLPTLREGFRKAEAVRLADERTRAQATALDVLPIGVAIMSTDGAVLFANELAREIFSTEPAFYIGNNGLGVRAGNGRLRFRDVLATGTALPSSEGEVYSLSIQRDNGRRPLTVIAMTVSGLGLTSTLDEPSVIVFIGDPERPTDIDPRRLTRLYGLSRAEARVAVLLAKGQRLEQVAESLDLTYETVRKHVKQIFGKTSTDRQAELVRTLTLGPAGLRL